MNLLDRTTKAVQAFRASGNGTAPKPTQGEIALNDPRNLLFPGGWYTPYNPSWLVGRKGLQIFDQMRRDDQIKAAMAFKKHTAVSAGWTVKSPDGKPDDWEPTIFAREMLGNIEKFNAGLTQILSALDYGYSITEKIWDQPTSGAMVGKIVPVALKTRKPHSFTFDSDPYGNLMPDGILQEGNNANKGRLPADKFIVYSYQKEFGNFFGTSDLESAYRAWWLKDNAYKWLGILLERMGVPPIFGMYNPAPYSPRQIDDLKDVIKNIQAATFGLIPRASKDDLELWAPELAGQASRVFIPSLEMLNQDIARALLMPGLLGMSPDQVSGSLARAGVHFDVFLLVVDFIRMEEAEIIQEGLLEPTLDLNFANLDAYPTFEFLPLTDNLRLDVLEKWAQLTGSGVVTKQAEDEKHIRTLLKFPELDEAKKLPGNADGGPARPAPPPPPRDRDKNPPSEETMAQKRRPGRYERQIDFAETAQTLNRIEDEARTELSAALEAVRDNAVVSVERSLTRGGAKYAGSFKLRGMGDFKEAMRGFLRSTYEAGSKSLKAELPRKFAETKTTFSPTEALRFLDRKMLWISGVVEDQLTNAARGILLNSLKYGETQAETIKKLQDLFEPYLGNEDVIRDGAVINSYRLENIIRTNATEAYNHGRLVMARDEDVREFVQGMLYSAVIDARTTEICEHLDGWIIPLSEPELDRLTPPNHFQCRSLLVAVTVDQKIDEWDLITPEAVGRAKALIQEGFK